ncbi:MAG: hypothetical protein IJ566_03970 [Cardiobacteriaceae bacterium]|nr:hypothetical protein [Cardiobacteriaceae bacterium]
MTILADPSLGNISLSKNKFIKYWYTTNDGMAGKVLVLFTENKETKNNYEFFDKNAKFKANSIIKNIKHNNYSRFTSK